LAANNLRILKGGYTVRRFRTEANVKLGIASGDAVKAAQGTGTNYVDLVLDGDPEEATDMFLGITRSGSTNTAAADGVVDVEIVGPGTIIEGKANTAANVNTDAKLLGLLFDFVCFDRSAATAAGTITIDEDEGTDTDVHGLTILDGDIVKGTLLVTPTNATLWRGLV
jgi:hypothetical protein